MMVRSPRRVTGVLVACVLTSGCNDPRKAKQGELEQERRRVSAESTHDASAAVVDEHYRFRLDPPGEGWQTVGEADARKANPEFLAMAVKQGTFAGVYAGHLPGVTLDGYLEMLESDDVGFIVESHERTRVGEHEAARVRFRSRHRGIETAHEVLLVLRGDYIYRVDVWRTAGSITAAEAAPVFAAFSLLDGEIVPREPQQIESRDSHGVGWLIREGVFRSVVSNIEAEGDDALRLLFGAELHDMHPLAEVGFMRENPTFFVVFSPRPWDVAPLSASRKLQAESLAAEFPDAHGIAALELSIAGQAVPVDWWDEGQMRYYAAPFDLDGRRMALQAWWPPALDERNRQTLTDAAARLRAMDATTRDATATALAELPDPEQAVGPGWAVRGGRYLDFEHGVRWAKPHGDDGVWSFLTGDTAVVWDPDAAVVLFDRRSGRQVILVYFDGVGSLDEDSWRRQVGETWPGIKELRREPTALADLPAELIVGQVEDEDGRQWAYIVTLRQGERGIVLLHESPGRVDHESLHDSLAGFELIEELPEIERRAGRWIDHRMGVALEPPSAWLPKDTTPAGLAAVSRVTTWSVDGQEKLLVLAVHPPQFGQDLDWAEGFLEQLARDSLGLKTKNVTNRRVVTIAGLPGRELTWADSPTSVTLTRKAGTFLIIFTSDPSDAQVRDVLGSVEFVE